MMQNRGSDASLPGTSTIPDQIEPGALRELELLPGERIARCWRTGFGFLVMTNLRCVRVWRKAELFARSEWHTGPTFFFYSLSAPQVVGGKFVQLADANEDVAGPARFLVRDASAVCREIEDARAAGRAEWETRRARAQQELHRPRALPSPPGTTVIVREIVRVRCGYCGNLMNATDSICPACGAPQR